MKKLMAITVAVVFLLTMAVAAPVAASTTWHVYDGDSIQDVIDDDASSGDTIIVHEGTYNENVHVYKSLTIQAAAGEDRPEVYGDENFAFLITADRVTVEGFEAHACAEEAEFVIGIEGAENVIIRNNEAIGGVEAGIGLDTANECEVIDNEVSDSSEIGILVKASTGNLIEGNEVASESGIGIALHENASDNRVIGNCVSAYNNTGIDVIDGSHHNLITLNRVTDSEIGIELSDAHDNDVVDNEVSDSWETGIALADGANDNDVLENEVSGSTEAGILVEESTGNLIKNNEVSDSAWGIELGRYRLLGGANDNEVVGNKVTDSTYQGISVYESTGNLIKNNEVSDSGRGIQLYDANYNEVIENEVTGSTVAGILVNLSTGNLIKENKVSDSARGIRISLSNDNEVLENKVSHSGIYGISLVSGASNNLVKENKVSRSGEYDLYWDGTGTGNTWQENKYKTSDPDPLP